MDPDVAETAALAHDLGHPPFGHIAEQELNRLAREADEDEGFEGNAQSFRILTKLAIRTTDYEGLNLSCASLNAVLKYPWLRAARGPHRRKWGVYHPEKTVFDWARTTFGAALDTRTAEAEIMDWADDIAYSVFDVDDFYRAGLIPLDRVFVDALESDRFLADARARLRGWGKDDSTIDAYIAAFSDLGQLFPARRLRGRFQGTIEQRAVLRSWTSELVSRYVQEGISLRAPGATTYRVVTINPDLKNEVEILKQLVWHYVIENPALLTQQQGVRTVIQRLFEFFNGRASQKDFDIFPEPYRSTLQSLDSEEHVRVVVDMISAMTERQAVRLYNRLMGVSLGSVLDQL